jgi:tetratricopeptide (TPR) repeat protein
VLASRSYSSVKSICRRACDNGLTAVLFEINIPKMTPLTYLNSDTIIFPLSTVFKLKSINQAPDATWHIQMELADSTMELINEQLYSTIGERLSWLTFGSYLARIEKYDIAEKYFKYLQSLSLNTQQYASIYTNMSLMYISMNGKQQEALDCLKEAEKLVQTYQADRSETTAEHSTLDDKINRYEQFAELHRKKGDPVYACLFYEKALKHTIDPKLHKLYQLKIKTLKK